MSNMQNKKKTCAKVNRASNLERFELRDKKK